MTEITKIVPVWNGESYYRLTQRNGMITVLTIVHENIKTDIALECKMRNQCWELLKLPSNIIYFGL